MLTIKEIDQLCDDSPGQNRTKAFVCIELCKKKPSQAPVHPPTGHSDDDTILPFSFGESELAVLS